MAMVFTNPAAAQSSAAREAQIVKALHHIEKNNWKQARNMIAALRDPTASKLYYWLLFQDQERSAAYMPQLQLFIDQNPAWPGREIMIVNAEQNMSDDLPQGDILKWFGQYPPQSAHGLMRYIDALAASGQNDKIGRALAQWWPQGSLGNKEQNDLLHRFGGMINRDAHRLRLDMTLFRNQYTNARALAKILGAGYPQLVEARIALAEKKNGVDVLIEAVPRGLQDDPGLLYERIKWRRKKGYDVGAIELLHRAPDAQRLQNSDEWWRERHILIRRLLEKKSYQSAYLLASQHKQKEGLGFAQAEFLSGWLALRFLDNAVGALQHFEVLYAGVETPISKARAAYWAGRALDDIGSKDKAGIWYEKAARFQTVFYGQLAAVRLAQKGDLPAPRLPQITMQQSTAFENDELFIAAKLLHKAGLDKTSSRFFNAFARHHNSAAAYYFAARATEDLKRYDDTIALAKKATDKGLFLTAQSYPTMTSALSSVDVEWALVHGLIRQESRFNQTIKSPAGAIGLMQLMPATAKITARKLGLSHRTSWLASRPSHNIRLGSAYIKQMLARYDGSYPLALAAYNAGPGRVDSWLRIYGDPRTGAIDILDWMEIVPIYETRNYMQRVTEAIYVYRLRLKNIQPDRAIYQDYISLPNLRRI